MKAQKYNLSDITADQSFSPRLEPDLDLINHYEGILDQLPPVSLWKSGGKLWLVDGFHRFAAAHQAGRAVILGEVVGTGDLKAARDFSDTANLRHGKRLSRAERREVARRFHERHPKWSANKVGKILGCAHTTVLADWQEGCGVTRIHRPGASEVAVALHKSSLTVSQMKLAESDKARVFWREVFTKLPAPAEITACTDDLLLARWQKYMNPLFKYATDLIARRRALFMERHPSKPPPNFRSK